MFVFVENSIATTTSFTVPGNYNPGQSVNYVVRGDEAPNIDESCVGAIAQCREKPQNSVDYNTWTCYTYIGIVLDFDELGCSATCDWNIKSCSALDRCGGGNVIQPGVCPATGSDQCTTGEWYKTCCFSDGSFGTCGSSGGPGTGTCIDGSQTTVCNNFNQCSPSYQCQGRTPASLCGNGQIDPGEQCDSNNLNGNTCGSVGKTGTPSCNSNCIVDYSTCVTTVPTPGPNLPLCYAPTSCPTGNACAPTGTDYHDARGCINAQSISGNQCGSGTITCPDGQIRQCTKTCTSGSCGSCVPSIPCCPAPPAAPTCGTGYPTPIKNSNGCTTSYTCACPTPPTQPQCQFGTELKTNIDSKNCVTGYSCKPIPCVQSFSLQPTGNAADNFDLPTKTAVYKKSGEYTWIIKAKEESTVTCPATYLLTDVVTYGKCDPSTGIFPVGTIAYTAGGKVSSFATSLGSPQNVQDVFKVHIKSNGGACSLTFNIKSSSGTSVDPGFSVVPPSAPVVAEFDYFGNNQLFTARWNAYYTAAPENKMNVECGLNCDPTIQDCAAIGKACTPYPFEQGTESLKKGSCTVTNPAYDFTQNGNKIKCLFYDPEQGKGQYTAVVNHDFNAYDFDINAPGGTITTPVGQPFILELNIINNGLFSDRYNVGISSASPEFVSVSSTSITTDSVNSRAIFPVIISVTPLVDVDNTISLTITSLDCPTCAPKTFTIPVRSGTYNLPEYGIEGFLQIVLIATVFLFYNPISKQNFRRR
ncbi:MAG: hypothetical protein HYW22_00710 [Candidatus Aenigmarchaeota archaeon]|nr:hypothetical protein [Candidatus Aenigmarchaeota archaeon]